MWLSPKSQNIRKFGHSEFISGSVSQYIYTLKQVQDDQVRDFGDIFV